MGSDSHKQLLALWTALDGGPKPRCRDCADYNGKCPSDNLPCEPQDRALEQIANLHRRLAAKPADEGLDIPRVMDVIRSRWNFEETDFGAIENVLTDAECLTAIRAFSITGEPKQ